MTDYVATIENAQPQESDDSKLDGTPEGTISPRGLLDELTLAPRRAQFISFASVTEPNVNKTMVNDRSTYNAFWEKSPEKRCLIQKESKVLAIIHANYGNSIDNALERAGIDPDEADFDVAEHSWAENVDGAPLVQHRYSGKYYLALHVQRTMQERPVYRWVDTGQELNEDELEDLQNYLPKKSSKKQEDAGLSASDENGENQQVVYRNYASESVVEIKMGGHHWLVREPDES